MQEAIMQIGSILSSGSMIDNLIEKVSPEKRGKKQYVLKLDFKISENRLVIDTNEEVGIETAKRYINIGRVGGPNSPQWFVTFPSIFNFMSQVFYNLKEIDLGEDLNNIVKKVFDNYYKDCGDGLNNNYRYLLDLKKFGISNKDVIDIESEVKKQGKKDKDIPSLMAKEIESYINKNFGMKFDEIGLCTALIDGMPICDYEEYKNEALKAKTGSSDSKKVTNSCCSFCGKTDNITDTNDLKKIKLKFFTTNQVIFANDLNLKNYDKNMILCSDCLNQLLSGEKYITNSLTTRLSGFSIYLIPHFLFGSPMNKDSLDIVSGKIKKSFNTVANYEDISVLKSTMMDFLESSEGSNYFLLNILFYKAQNASTKVQKLIRDVTPSRFDEIAAGFTHIYELSKSVLGDEHPYKISLGKIYYMIPVRVSKGDPQEYKDLLSIYDSIFSNRKIDRKFIIDNILGAIKTQYYEKADYNTSNASMEFTMVNGNFFIEFLRFIDCIKEEDKVESFELNVRDEIKSYIIKMSYNEQQAALFLLGYMIGEVGNSQYQRTKDKKPVLNKLNFGGIDKVKLIRIVNDIFNKMKQEKILQYNEVVFYDCKRLLDENLPDWKLNKNENLFYILSGYGYATVKPMLNKKGGNENE